jgi:hypothetical protein
LIRGLRSAVPRLPKNDGVIMRKAIGVLIVLARPQQ